MNFIGLSDILHLTDFNLACGFFYFLYSAMGREKSLPNLCSIKYAKDRPRYNQLWGKAPMNVNGEKMDPLRHTLVARKKQNIFSLKAGSDMLRLSPVTFWYITFPFSICP